MFDINFNFDTLKLDNFNNELKCLYLSKYLDKIDKNIVLVTSTLYEANYLYQVINKYTPNVLLFPMDDFLTSVALAISPELKITRLETLNTLGNKEKYIIITNLMGYLRYLPTFKNYNNASISINKNDVLDIKDLEKNLFNIGYTKDVIVNKTGDIASRGYVLDIFPVSFKNPIRVEFWGDTVDSIRVFDLNTQLTIENIDNVLINPNSEFIAPIDSFSISHYDLPKYTDVSNISNYTDSVVFFDNYKNILISYERLMDEVYNYNISINDNIKYMFDIKEIKNSREINFDSLNDTGVNNVYDIEPFNSNTNDINNRLNKYISNKTVILCLSSRYVANKVIDELNNGNIVFTDISNIYDNKINVIIKDIMEGFIYDNLVVISENIFFNRKSNNHIYKTNFKIGSKIRDISKLNIGDYVVHISHGIGKYLGIKRINNNGFDKDYLTIEYKDSDRLYVPVEKIELITKYSSGEGVEPKINKLGGTEWAKAKLNARSKAKDMAIDLLKLYAIRENSKGFAFKKDDKLELMFDKSFQYQETVDQIRVIDEIKSDMEKDIPMDRLVCGDVGFGKTEVAFRAMFKAVLSGKQVALLCPTTILSQQHYQNAVARFKDFPVEICVLNRYVKSGVLKENLKKILYGKVDIVIGTHSVLSSDVVFKDLGLLVIDEEQRFGVKHKERIKELKANIDVLTLSATPIPRTLQMAYSGLRNLSLIETPPLNRYPVETYVLAYNNYLIKDAIYKEMSRNGQVFILYNNIEGMDNKYNEIKSLVPNANIVCAHGRMEKNELEDIMYKFTNKEYDVLICTTIIETGIDIPNANTLIIIDADHFGLSQLYQIRGRVGRSNKIAYCYLFYDNSKILNEIAVKRLKAIKEFTELGSGLSIAMRDLSIRGAGNILGSEQSGFVTSVGVEMFMNMLAKEIDKLKGIDVKEVEDINPLINVETSISDNYVKDEELKIEIHRKINSIESFDDIDKIKNELEDRFGKLPDTLNIYMYEELFEKRAKELGINEIHQTKNFIDLYIPDSLMDKINGEVLFVELYKLSRYFRLSNKVNRYVVTLDTVKLDKHFIFYLFDLLDVIEKSFK